MQKPHRLPEVPHCFGMLTIVLPSMEAFVISKETSTHCPLNYHLLSLYFVPGIEPR